MMAPAIEGTRNVLKACSATNVQKLIQVSSVGAILLNEDWPQDKIKDESCWSDKEFARKNKVSSSALSN
jgi:nucleoside-diphosphate-sugar epimerase